MASFCIQLSQFCFSIFCDGSAEICRAPRLVFSCHPLVEVKIPFLRAELVWVILNENAMFLTDLFHDRGNIVARKLLGPF